MAADPHESLGPDNWDDIEDPGPGLANQFSSLNVAAKPFIPNMNAPAFVPSYGNATNTKPDLDATGNGNLTKIIIFVFLCYAAIFHE